MNKAFADISSNNTDVDLALYAKWGFPLIAIKLGGGQGDQWDSYPEFGEWWITARKVHLKRWAYWYWRDTNISTSGYDQAKQIDKLIRANGPQVHGDRIVLDFETMLTNPSHNIDQLRQCFSILKRMGHTPLLYASPGFLNSYNNPQFGVDLWIADWNNSYWNPENAYKIAAWQHSSVVDTKGIGIAPFGAQGIGWCDMSILTSYGIRKHLR